MNMVPVSDAWFCRNFYTQNFSSPGVPAGSVPKLEDYWSLDLDMTGWNPGADHSISFQTERFEGAVDKAMTANAKRVAAYTGEGGTVKDSSFPSRPPQQMSGMGFDATPNLTVKGYVIDQGIRGQKTWEGLVKGGGVTLGTIAWMRSPLQFPGFLLLNMMRSVKDAAQETLEREGYVPPGVY